MKSSLDLGVKLKERFKIIGLMHKMVGNLLTIKTHQISKFKKKRKKGTFRACLVRKMEWNGMGT